MSKKEATRLADHIRIDQDWCEEAAALLRRWPDGEPVMCPGRPDSRCHYVAHCGQVCNKCGNIHDGSISEVSQALRAQSDGEPVAWLVEGWHDGKLIAHIVHLTLDEANNSASVFATHYSTVRKFSLYTAPQSERIIRDGTILQAERIAALEAALAERDRVIEAARNAMSVAKHFLATAPNAMASGAYEDVLSALRAIEGVR